MSLNVTFYEAQTRNLLTFNIILDNLFKIFNFLKAVYQKFNLVRSGIHFPMCGKAKAKLFRVAPSMNCNQKMLMHAFFCLFEEFNYYPLVWMLHSRKLNSKINRLRDYTIMYNNNPSTFEELLELDNSVSIHHRNLQCLAMELYKIFSAIPPDIMNDIFPLNILFIYDIRKRQMLYTRFVKSVYRRNESLSSLAPKIWNLIS